MICMFKAIYYCYLNFRNICIDMLLLADVFENFRNMCIENYKLDPAKYLAAPG